ncbi:MAG: ATP-binding cassette domain-containing protein [Rubrivivax sp.]|jgi:ABC-type branched-subunit amino acid transport system ATPase component|nr:ATP-binding cassette domain-containing protein [Rubrivivax sp.]
MSIEVDRVTVRFGGVVALQDVSLTLERGRIVTVIGPNGSGKSTLFNSITGLVKVAGGAVRIDGADVRDTPPHRRIARGLARSFQTPRFDPRVSVEDAVLCGFFPVARGGFVGSLLRMPQVSREEHEFARDCERILADFGLDAVRHAALGELPMGQVRLVEVARAIAHRPSYLLLDEPAAGLTRSEQTLLADEIRRVAAVGVGVLLVEHNFALVRELSHHAVVLDRGCVLASGDVNELMNDPAFVAAYLGSSQPTAEASA